MALKIAFIGYNNQQTREKFRQLALDNAEQVSYFDAQRNRLQLRDGSTIQAITSPVQNLDGVRYDQVILADDRRLNICHARAFELSWLWHVTSYSDVPEEFKFLVYDLDAELKKEG